MPDYKEMYLKLFRASEQAISTLIAAQRECEEMYKASNKHIGIVYNWLSNAVLSVML